MNSAQDSIFKPDRGAFDILPTVDVVPEFPSDLDKKRIDQQGLLPNSVKTRHLAPGAVGTEQLANSSVTNDILAPSSVFSTNLNLSGSMISRVPDLQTTNSTGFVSLGIAGPVVTVNINPSGVALVIFSCQMAIDTNNQYTTMSFTASGANSVTAGTYNLIIGSATSTDVMESSRVILLTGLNPGSTLFLAQYKVSGGTGTFSNRELSVIPL